MANLYYKPSCKFSPSGVALSLVGGLVAGLLLAYAYSYLISYVPFIYVHFFFTIGYGLLLGISVGLFMRWGKVRNRWVSALVALIVGFISLYLSWAVWVSVQLGKGDINIGAMELAQQPGFLWETIKRINEIGWNIRSFRLGGAGAPISGVLLWAIWLAEALIVLGATVIAAEGAVSTEPFCEACKSWCKKTQGLMLLGEADSGELKRRMEAKDFDYLKTLGPKKEGQYDWTSVDLYECPGCGQTNALSVVHEHLTVDAKGKSSKKGGGVVDNLLLGKSDVFRLRQINQELNKVQAQPQAG